VEKGVKFGALAREYDNLVAAFRWTTRDTWPLSKRCCREVRDGAPECCYQIIDGAELTFTVAEVGLLVSAGVFATTDFVVDAHDELVLNREPGYLGWTAEQLEMSLNGGALANTLECASHPLRPVLGPGKYGVRPKVLGVVAIDGCNTGMMLDEWKNSRDELIRLWQRAVDLVGPKRYYVRWALKPEWRTI
jgi:hypothetical protein